MKESTMFSVFKWIWMGVGMFFAFTGADLGGVVGSFAMAELMDMRAESKQSSATD